MKIHHIASIVGLALALGLTTAGHGLTAAVTDGPAPGSNAAGTTVVAPDADKDDDKGDAKGGHEDKDDDKGGHEDKDDDKAEAKGGHEDKDKPGDKEDGDEDKGETKAAAPKGN